jgi:uncharacterized protein YerC
MTPTNAQDVVAVLAADFTQVFPKARAIKATISRTSRAMEHPLETGATITDHRIVLPTTIELSLILASADYKTVYQQVRDLFRRGELLTVQTRVDSFASMLIEKMPHEETPEMFDGVALALSLKEAQFVQPQFSSLKVAQPRDSNTANRGQQQPTESPAARKSSILGSFFK